jgi:hypothetical protein
VAYITLAASPSPGEINLKCFHCGKTTVVRTNGKGEEFLHRCGRCHGYHKFTSAGRHGSGAINYRVTKIDPPSGSGK